MKVALYARVSKSDDSQTTENQLLRLREYAKAESFQIYEEYQDFASGADPNRPALERMLRDAKGHRFSLILAVRLDRIARSMVNFHDMLKGLDEAHVRFHCVDQPEISTDTSTGKLVMGILGYVAQFERDLIRDRTKAGLVRAKAQGAVLGRPKKIVSLKKIEELKESGISSREIARQLGISKRTLQRRAKNEGGKTTLENSQNQDGANTDDYGAKEVEKHEKNHNKR